MNSREVIQNSGNLWGRTLSNSRQTWVVSRNNVFFCVGCPLVDVDFDGSLRIFTLSTATFPGT